MDKKELKKQSNKILEQHKKGELTTDKARRLLFVLTGISETSTCSLDRVKKECSVWLYTSGKCESCYYSC
jgi:hypothetical protein